MAGRSKSRTFFKRIDPLTSLLLVFPLFLVYQVGIVLVPSAFNGADLITSRIVRLLHGQVGAYVALNAGLLALFVGCVVWFKRSHSFDPRSVWPVLLESGLYALSMGSVICYVMLNVLHIDPRLAFSASVPGMAPGVLASIIISIGAGVHEELLFRVILVGGTTALLEKAGMKRAIALLIAFVVSSVLFSAAHHVIGGEPFTVTAFTYRILCGLIFATIYQFRGVAIAVYTHALYDIYVFLIH